MAAKKKYVFTAKRRAALKKAQRASAAKRRKGGTPKKRRTTKRKTTKKKATSTRTTARKPAKRRSTARKTTRRKSNPGIKMPKLRTLVKQGGEQITKAGVGVAGAIGTAAAVNAMPIPENVKGVTTVGLGILAATMVPKSNKLLQMAAVGAIFAGTMKLVKDFMPNVPMIAGDENKRIPYYGAPSPVPMRDGDLAGIIDFKLAGTENFAGTEDFAGTENFAGNGACDISGWNNYGTY